jgi:nucleoside 2-deoxyribosyltransferase
MRVYLCGPINGCTDEECRDWREMAKLRLPDTLDPMRRDYRGKEHSAVREIVELDKIDVTNSDIILVNYDKPSVGTSMEMLYAWERGKMVIVVHKADAGLSPWLVYHSHYRFTSFDEAFSYLESL